MSLLERMRSGTDSTLMQIVLVLVVVSFIGWGVLPQGDQKRVVATVNGVEILQEDFQPVYAQMRDNFYRQVGDMPTEEQEAKLVLDTNDYLVQREVLSQRAAEIGLEVHSVEVLAAAGRDQNFWRGYAQREAEPKISDWNKPFNADDPDGPTLWAKFNEYLEDVTRQKMTDWEIMTRKQLLANKLFWLVTSGSRVSEPELRKSYAETQTRMDMTYVALSEVDFRERVEVSDEDVTAFLADEASAEAVSKRYDRDKARKYVKPATVTLRRIELALNDVGPSMSDLREKLQGFQDTFAAGSADEATFDRLARIWSTDETARRGGLLDAIVVTDLDEEMQKAIDGVEVGSVSEIIGTSSSVSIYYVSARTASSETSLEDARDEIARLLIAKERAPALARSTAENIRSAWRTEGLPVVLFAEAGLLPQSTGLQSLNWKGGLTDPPPEMWEAARDAESGLVDEIFEARGQLFVGAVGGRIEADMKGFDEQRARFVELALARQRYVDWSTFVDEAIAASNVQMASRAPQ